MASLPLEKEFFINHILTHAVYDGQKNNGFFLSEMAELLLVFGKVCNKYAENDCNGVFDASGNEQWCNTGRGKLAWAVIEQRIDAIVNAIGCTAVIRHDPRGYCLLIQTPDGFSNHAEGGIYVPTS